MQKNIEMKQVKFRSLEALSEVLSRPVFEQSGIEKSVCEIINQVRNLGDKALKFYTEAFDHVKTDSLEVSEEEIREAEALVPEELKQSIMQAAANIEKFHTLQQQAASLRMQLSETSYCELLSKPIQRVGIYIPGGSAPLFSTVLMLAIPAKIAGCKETVLVSPPQKNGKINPVVLYAGSMFGVSRFFKVGGAQAIAALAYGTETIRKVDKIFGPGNQFVTVAKQLVNTSGVAIDMPAGPSEVLVMADKCSNPAYVAADLLAQAEHGEDSQVVLVSNSSALIENTMLELERQISLLGRQSQLKACLQNSACVLVDSYEEMIEVSDFYAPEHLIIMTENADELARKINNAGSVFIGAYAPESAGDYATGTNHTLPTNGAARAFSGVNLASFMKTISFQKLDRDALFNLKNSIEIMSEYEGLQAHKNAVSIRFENGN